MSVVGFERELKSDFLAAATLEYELYRANANPVFNLVRKEPRFIELMKKINLQPYLVILFSKCKTQNNL